MSKTVKIRKNKLTKGIKEIAAKTLEKGGIVAFPTDTVYGIGAIPGNKKAVGKLFKIKKRPLRKPIPILISSTKYLKKVASKVPSAAKKLIKKHWPGALTLILPKSRNIPSFVTMGSKNVAVRMPNNKIALEIIDAAGGMIAVTSANISGKKAAVSANEIKKLRGVDLIIDSGRTKIKKASTIALISGKKVYTLRKGSVKLS